MKVNENFRLLSRNYLFTEVGKRIREYKEQNPEAEIIRMDIGDVTLPLPRTVIEAMHKAVDEFSNSATFHGYGPEQGYEFLRKAIADHDYKARNITIDADEIFISDGAKSDIGNIGDLFSTNCRIALCDPGYPVYADSNVIDGRAGIPCERGFSKFIYLDCNEENGFVPSPPNETPDVVYLCFPNNPTGAAISRDRLREWVEYALSNRVLIIYDSAYEAYINDPNLPRSIYEIPRARETAIEVRSFSKTAGFTGLRLGYTVVPHSLRYLCEDGNEVSLHDMWRRRQTTKFNGASYIVQRGGEALFTPDGLQQTSKSINYYLENARALRCGLENAGFRVTGGENSPYVWAKCEGKHSSWQIFDKLLRECRVSTTPGCGFGECGEGYIRLTGFNSHENTLKALKAISRLKNL